MFQTTLLNCTYREFFFCGLDEAEPGVGILGCRGAEEFEVFRCCLGVRRTGDIAGKLIDFVFHAVFFG